MTIRMIDVVSFETFHPKRNATIGFHVDKILSTTNHTCDKDEETNTNAYVNIGYLADILNKGESRKDGDDGMDNHT